jgi:hypothetical protein
MVGPSAARGQVRRIFGISSGARANTTRQPLDLLPHAHHDSIDAFYLHPHIRIPIIHRNGVGGLLSRPEGQGALVGYLGEAPY